jgi:hypothetical protein
MPLKFSYKKFPSNPNEAFPDHKHAQRPVIPITVKYGGKEISYLALIDSGADFCIFHGEIGEYLGIDIKSGKRLEFFGVTGEKECAYFHNIIISVGGHDVECYCGFSDFNNCATQLPYGILGQKGFFDKFKVSMDYTKSRIELSAH